MTSVSLLALRVLATLASSSPDCKETPATGSTPSLQKCIYNSTGVGQATLAQLWTLPTPGTGRDTDGQPITLAYTFWEGLCLDGGSGKDRTPVKLVSCDPSRSREQSWILKPLAHESEGLGGVSVVHAASGLCVSVAHNSKKTGATLDLSPCQSNSNYRFDLSSRTAKPQSPGQAIVAYATSTNQLCLSACTSASPPPRPPPPAPNPLPIVLNGSAPGLRYDGYWAMAVNGAARLLFEYPEPVRTQLLDLFFVPRGKGTAWQALKVEIGGDVESSYGSMTSYMHTPTVSDASFKRGVIWWLIAEARKRNPTLPLAALSCGMPWWVGNGKTLSKGGAKYHVDWLLGAKLHHNLTFDFIGIWNEAPWTAEYILELRSQLDRAGLHATKIMAADGDTSVIKAAQQNATLADAIGAFGVHTSKMVPIDTLGKPYYESENDIVDGPMPQWSGTDSVGIHWPKQFISNIVSGNGTAAMLCAFAHGWSQNLGRHNHGPLMLNDPWSGFYQLGAGFFTQAHVTQFTEIGDRFVGSAIDDKSGVSYAALASKNGQDVTIVATNEDSGAARPLKFSLAGTLAKALCGVGRGKGRGGGVLERWQSNASRYFIRLDEVSLAPGANCSASVLLPPSSVTTLSSRAGVAGWEDYAIPKRTRWKLPYDSAYAKQTMDNPCEFLSPIYGSFEVTAGPSFHRGRGASAGAGVCTQAVPVNPGPNAWTHRFNGWPIALLPSGSNAVNVDAVAVVAFDDQDIQQANDDAVRRGVGAMDAEPEALTLCGRVPIWSPSACMPSTHAIGVCLSLLRDAARSPTASQGVVRWRLTEAHNNLHQPKEQQQHQKDGVFVGITANNSFRNECKDLTILANGTLPPSASGFGVGVGAWATLGLSFDDEFVTASINGKVVAAKIATHVGLGGAVALGSGWNVAHFKSLSTAVSPLHPAVANSFLFDLVPSENTIKQGVTPTAEQGSKPIRWGGFILDLSSDAATGWL